MNEIERRMNMRTDLPVPVMAFLLGMWTLMLLQGFFPQLRMCA